MSPLRNNSLQGGQFHANASVNIPIEGGRVMRGKRVAIIVSLMIAVSFVLGVSLALAAGKSYCVIKGKDNVCKVIKCDKATPATIEGGGPFPDKAAAEKVKKDKCPKIEKKPKAEKKPKPVPTPPK
jgi:hypothetical protein